MKSLRYLLPVYNCLLGYSAFAQVPGFRVYTQQDATLFEKLMADLDASHLFHLYRADLKLKGITRNRHDPTVKDSTLVVATGADRLSLFKNRYKALLRSATITSTKVNFNGMRVGVSKESFCRTLHLSPAYDVYACTDGMENFMQLTFTFTSSKLKSVEYKELLNLDAID